MPDVNEFELYPEKTVAAETTTAEPTDVAMAKMATTMPLLADTIRMFVEIAKGYRAQLVDTWPKDTSDALSADLLHTLIHRFLEGGQ